MKSILSLPVLSIVMIAALTLTSDDSWAQLLRVGVAGLSHDHAHGILQHYKKGEVIILGIAESDASLVARYQKQYQLPDSLFFTSLTALLDRTKPEAVLAYNPISEHIDVVEACAPRGISVMVEKPLATTVKQALRMQELAAKYKIQILTNYETTWYASNHTLYQKVKIEKSVGPIRKMVVHDGHGGPKEIGCSREFLAWLTDPIKNGGGALTDFGCYGANLMTWLMDGQAPLAVTAVIKHIKPGLYPTVDDEATILLEYPQTTGIIEASWNWPFGIKDLEVFGVNGYLHAMNGTRLQERTKDVYEDVKVTPPTYPHDMIYLEAVLRHKVSPAGDLCSFENNLLVVRILEAASRSAREGRRIEL